MKRGKIFAVAIAIILVMTFTGSFLDAQSGHGKGRLKGKVLDADGNPIKGAKVEMFFKTDSNVKFERTTDETGEFTFSSLGSGEWRMTATAPGYVPDRASIKVSQMIRNPESIFKLKKVEDAVGVELENNANIIEKGNQAFEAGNYEDALAAFRDFLALTPEFFEVHVNIANCLMKMEKYDEAIAEYNLFMEKAGSEARPEVKAKCLASIGEIHLKKGDMATAQSFFMKSVDLNPKDEILAYNVGEIFFGNNKYDEALKYFEVARDIKPEWSIPYLKLGYVYSNTGDMKKAIENFKKFVQLDPENPETPVINELIKGLEEM